MLNLYRRHQPPCRYASRRYRNCTCPIWVQGSLRGEVQPREIGQFRLNAGVVVLSACDTAVGPTLGQEGVLNIARAFLLAGARSVITTLWAVSDATSTAVMRRFYENLAAGQDIAEALTRGKAAVIEQFGSDALATVAAFQIIGIGDHRIAIQRAPRRGQAPPRFGEPH